MARVFNADPNNQRLRQEAYRDEYVELIPSASVFAIPCPEGVELHMPGGAIVSGRPGSWVRELEGGGMAILTPEDVAKNFRPAAADAEADRSGELDENVERDREAFEKAQVSAHRPNAKVATVPFAGEPDPYETGTRIAGDETTEGDEAPDRGGRGAVDEQVAAQQQKAKEDGEDDELTAEKKAELRSKLHSQALAAEARLQQIVATAFNAEIISQDEQHGWLATGEPPLDVIVEVDDSTGDIRIERKPGHDQARRAEIAAREAEAEREAEEMRNLAEQQAADEAQQNR